ncbi:hypothetical protein AAH978_17470 [Streptomyces sp. ZYX-F-203]
MTLPEDVDETFEDWETGDSTVDAVLIDAANAQTAVTFSVTQGNPESDGLKFYQIGTALAGSQDWVKDIVDSGLTYSGSASYFAPEVEIFDEKSAAVTYCADERTAFNKNRQTGEADEIPPSDDSFVRYSTRLEKGENEVWQTSRLESERGNPACIR